MPLGIYTDPDSEYKRGLSDCLEGLLRKIFGRLKRSCIEVKKQKNFEERNENETKKADGTWKIKVVIRRKQQKNKINTRGLYAILTQAQFVASRKA